MHGVGELSCMWGYVRVGGKFIHFFIDISWVDGTGHQKNRGAGIYTVDQIG